MIELILALQLTIPSVQFVCHPDNPKDIICMDSEGAAVVLPNQGVNIPWYKNEKRIWLLFDMTATGGDISVTSHCIGSGDCVEGNGLIKFIEKYPTLGGLTKTFVDGIVMWVITEIFDRNKVWGRILYAVDIGISVAAMTINNKRLGRIGR